MKIVLDAEQCQGHGRCYVLAPQLFEDDDRGYGVVKGDGSLTDDLLAVAHEAVVGCPEKAISIID